MFRPTAACLVTVLLASLFVATPALPNRTADARGTIEWGQTLALTPDALEYQEDGATDEDILFTIISVLQGSILTIEPPPTPTAEIEIIYGLQVLQSGSPPPAAVTVSGLDAMGAAFTQTDLRAGRISIRHVSGEACDAGQFVGFSFTVSNLASNVSDATTGSFFADTTNPPVPSLVTNARGSVSWGRDTVLTTLLLDYQGPNDGACDEGLMYTINSIYPATLVTIAGSEGNLTLNSTGPFSTFTEADVQASKVSIAHVINDDVAGDLIVGFTYQVSHGDPVANGAPQTESGSWEAVVGAPQAPQQVARNGGTLQWKAEQNITMEMLNYESSSASPSDILYTIDEIVGVHLTIKSSINGATTILTPDSQLVQHIVTQQQINDGLVSMRHEESAFCGAGGSVGFLFRPRYLSNVGQSAMYQAKLIGAPPPSLFKNVPGALPWNGTLPLKRELLDYTGPQDGSCDTGLVYTVTGIFPGTQIIIKTNDPPAVMTNTSTTLLKFTELEMVSNLVDLRHDPAGECSPSGVLGFTFVVSHGDPVKDFALQTDEATYEAFLGGSIPAPALKTMEEGEVLFGGELVLSEDLVAYTGPGSSDCDLEQVYSITSVNSGAKVYIVRGDDESVTTVNSEGPFPVYFSQDDVASSKVSIQHIPAETCAVGIPIGFSFKASHGDPEEQGAVQAPEAALSAYVTGFPAPTMVKNNRGVMPRNGNLTLTPQLLEYQGPSDGSCDEDLVYIITEVYNNTHVLILSSSEQPVTVGPGNRTNVTFTKAQMDSWNVKIMHKELDSAPTADGTLAPSGFRFQVSLGDPEEYGSLKSEESTFEARVQSDEGPLMITNAKGVVQFGEPLTLGSELLEFAAPTSVDYGGAQQDVQYVLVAVDPGVSVLLDSVVLSPETLLMDPAPVFSQSDIAEGAVQLVHDGSMACTVGAEIGFQFRALVGNSSDPEAAVMTSLSKFSVEVKGWPAPTLVTNSQEGELRWNREMPVNTQMLDFSYGSATGGTCDTNQMYEVTAVTEGVELVMRGARPLTVTTSGPFPQRFTQLDLDLGNVQLRHLSAEVCIPGALVGFSFRVSHGSPADYGSIQTSQQDFRVAVIGAPRPTMVIPGDFGSIDSRDGQLVMSSELLDYQGPNSGECDAYIMYSVERVSPGTQLVIKQASEELVLSGNGPFTETFLRGDLVAGNVALRLSKDAQCDTSIGSFGFSFRASLGDPETQSAAQTSSTTFEASVSGAVPSSCSGRPPPAATPPPASRPPPAAPVCAGVFDQAGECCFTVLNSAGQCCAGTVNAASECCPASSPADKCGVCGGEDSCSIKITVQANLGINVEGLEDESFRASFVSRFIYAMAIILDVPKDKLEVGALRVLPALQVRRKLSSEVSGFHARRLLQQGAVEIELAILSPVTAQETVFLQAIADADAGTVSDLTEGDVTGISVSEPLGRAGTCGNDVCEVGEVCQGDEDAADCCIADCPNRLLECPVSSATNEAACSGHGTCIQATGECSCFLWLGFLGDSCSECPEGTTDVNGQCTTPPEDEGASGGVPILLVVLPVVCVVAVVVAGAVAFVMYRQHQNRIQGPAPGGGLGQPILESVQWHMMSGSRSPSSSQSPLSIQTRTAWDS